MLLVLIRALFVLIIGSFAARTTKIVSDNQLANPYLVFVGVMLAAAAVIVGDLLTPRKKIQTISAVYIGLIVGIVLTDLLRDALQPSMALYLDHRVHQMFMSFIYIFICYVCISTLLQTKDDFRFIIPYVEFSKEVKG